MIGYGERGCCCYWRECVATLALGLRPRQGGCKVLAKKKIRESHHMLLGVQRVWGNEPSHSQVNSHVRNWSPKWPSKFSECNFRGQNPLPWRVFYIIGKILKRRCLKWACITHLDTWNISYDQKKGRKSNWQFDSWPLKIRNRPNFLACRWRATYCCKALDKGYNFSLDLIVIKGFHGKLCAPKVAGVPVAGISELPFGSLGTKSHLDVAPVERHRVYYKGDGGASPKFRPWWVLCVRIACGSS
jgi:hypothetical protein